MDLKELKWRLKLKSDISRVYEYLTSDEGRASFWAESAKEVAGEVHFQFINGWKYTSKIIKTVKNSMFCLNYFDTKVTFELVKDMDGGTILTLINENIPENEFHDFHAGWVSVLLALKAACDHEVDLRNHHPGQCWDQGFVGN